MKRRWATLPVLTVMSLTGCGEFRKLDEMRANTGEMNNTTKELLDTTGEMKDTTEAMRSTTEDMSKQTGALLELTEKRLVPRLEKMEQVTGELYDSLRQGDAAALRLTSFESMLETKTLQNRLAEAGLFLMSFEFQLFGGGSQDATEERRLALYHHAMMEFMLRLDELAPYGGKVWPDAMPDSDRMSARNRAAAFAALAGALHKLNRKQIPDPLYGKPMSVYDLFIESLKAKPLMNRGALKLPEGNHYMKEVLSRPERVKQLLQTRYNMFVYLLLGSTTDMAEKSELEQLIQVLKGIDIHLDSRKMGAAHLDFIIEEVLQYAVQTRQDMIDVGIQPEFTPRTKFLVSKITLRTSGEEGVFSEKQRKALALWNEYVGRAPNGDKAVRPAGPQAPASDVKTKTGAETK